MKSLLLVFSFLPILSFAQNSSAKFGMHGAAGVSSSYRKADSWEHYARPSYAIDMGVDFLYTFEKNITFSASANLRQNKFVIDSLYYYQHGSIGGAPPLSYYFQKSYSLISLDLPLGIGYTQHLKKTKDLSINYLIGASAGLQVNFSEKTFIDHHLTEQVVDNSPSFISYSFIKVHLVFGEKYFNNVETNFFFGPKFEFSNTVINDQALHYIGYERLWSANFQIGVLF